MVALRSILLAVAALLPVAALAQVPADSDSAAAPPVPDPVPDTMMQVTLPELQVVGKERSSTLSSPTAVTTTDLRSTTASSGRPLSDLLAARTNLFVKRYGSGGLATASMRGLGSSQTQILVDGQRVADPQTGQADLALLPSLLVESAQVLHGTQGGRYGSGTLGGVVQLQTLQPSAPLRVEMTGGMGAYGWQTAGGSVSSAGDQWRGLVAVEGTRSEGDFPFENTSLTPTRTQRRKNADRRHATVFGKVTRQGSASQSTATLWWNDVTRGLPGTANAAASTASQHDTQWRLSGRHRRAFSVGQLRLAVRGQRSSLRFRNPAVESQFSQSDTSRTYQTTAEATAHLPLSSAFFLTAGATGGYDQAALRDGVHRWRAGAFIDATWSLGRLTLHPSLRLDADRPSGPGRTATALSPQLGAVWQPGPSWFRLKGQIGRAFRTPTFNERFHDPGGNPSLRAESGWSAETGAAVQVGSGGRTFRSTVTVFATRLDNQIVWQPSFVGPGLQVWRPSNVGSVFTRGLEWTSVGEWRLNPQVKVKGRLSFRHTAATDQSRPQARSFGKQLPQTPRQQLKARAGLQWRNVRLNLSTRAVGTRYVTADESQSLPPYHVTDAQLRIRKSIGAAKVTASLSVKNLLDEDYSVVRLFPMPPRHLRTRLTVTLP